MEPCRGGAHPYALMSRQSDPVKSAFVYYGRTRESTICLDPVLFLDRFGEQHYSGAEYEASDWRTGKVLSAGAMSRFIME